MVSKCRPTSWHSHNLKFEGYSWDFPNRNIIVPQNAYEPLKFHRLGPNTFFVFPGFVFVLFSPGGRSMLVMRTTPLPILKVASWQLPEGMWMRINRLVVWNHVSQNISTLQQFLTYLQGICKPRAQSPKQACCRNEHNSAEHPAEQFPQEAS